MSTDGAGFLVPGSAIHSALLPSAWIWIAFQYRATAPNRFVDLAGGILDILDLPVAWGLDILNGDFFRKLHLDLHSRTVPLGRNADRVRLSHSSKGFPGGDRDVCVCTRDDEGQGEGCQSFHVL